MWRRRKFLAALFCGLATGGAAAAESPVVSANQLIGNTLSAVAFVRRSHDMPDGNGPNGGELARIMLQAYLGAGGRALVRAWDASRNGYTAPMERRWSLTGSTLCVDVPLAGPQPICADIHIWGPRIAGVGVKPYAMFDGDLQPGNALGVR
ncbi:MAG TPA: hypothetical protein VM782_14765 [Stellaceae bacterium]|nr:hypothetical protein [Stellaceae bacterium]